MRVIVILMYQIVWFGMYVGFGEWEGCEFQGGEGEEELGLFESEVCG